MVDVKKGIKVKIYPTQEQKDMFHKNFGCCRKAYNVVLAKYNQQHKKDSSIMPTLTFLNELLNEAKKEFPYLNDVESTSLQQEIRDLAQSFSNFFKNPSHFNKPTFHKKKTAKLAFRQTVRQDIRIINKNKMILRKYGKVKFHTSPEYFQILNDKDTKFNNATISFDGIDYFTTFNIDSHEEEWELTGKNVGCDINSNVNGWLVTSDENKEYFDINHENQMVKLINRKMAKCTKGSIRWKEQKIRLLKWYHQRTNKLNDYLEKLSTEMVKEYDTIVFEKNYSKIKILIGGEQNLVFPLTGFIDKLEKKFAWHKPQAEGVVFVDAKYSTKKCHFCGNINHELDVKTRKWKCPKCGKTLDRDINAAINILNRWDYGDSLENAKQTSGTKNKSRNP